MDPQQAIQAREKGIRYLTMRVQLFPIPMAVIVLGMLVPMIIESSNQKKVHAPTILCAFLNLLFWFVLSALTYNLSPSPDNNHGIAGYAAIKLWLHICVLSLVTFSFSLSLMMRMNKVVTILTLVAAAAFVAHRAWQCARTDLAADVAKYSGLEEVIHHLIQLSTMATTMLLGAWFSSSFFYFQNYQEDDRDAWLLPSQYLTFFISVAASLTLLKSIARSQQPLWKILVLVYGLYTGLVALALLIGASRSSAGRYRWWAPLALVPEAVALAVWFVLWVKHMLENWGAPPDAAGGGHGEQQQPQAQEAVVLGAFAVVMALVSYSVKSFAHAMSTLYDEVFVISLIGAGVAALGWRMLNQPPIRAQAPGVHAAARTLAWFAICLAGLSLVLLFGIIIRLVRRQTTS